MTLSRAGATIPPGTRRLAWEVLFAITALSAAVPLFAARYIPIQDLPQHVAAVRVLHDYRVPELGFERWFELRLGSTQYLSVYLLADLLAGVLGALGAVKAVLAASVVALPYAMRALLAELGRPRSYALLAIPLAYNAHLILGFVNFLAAIPLAFVGLALAVRMRRTSLLRDAILLGVVLLVCFYTHVVPFGVLALGVVLVAAGDSARTTLRRMAPLAPSVLASAVWLATNPAGQLLAGSGEDPQVAPQFAEPGQALRALPEWLTDVFHGAADEWNFVAWTVLVGGMFLIGRHEAASAAEKGIARFRLGWLAVFAWAGYFVLPASYGFIWPINARFPLLALLFAIPSLPVLARRAQGLVCGAAVVLSGVGCSTAFASFRGAQAEYEGLSTIVASVPSGSRVAGLIWERGSRYVRFAPYLHAAAWVQAERGGVAFFSFADFPQSPFRFRASDRPPRVAPRWEWKPDSVAPERDLDWFDYVLTRGGPPVSGFRPVLRRGSWALWQR